MRKPDTSKKRCGLCKRIEIHQANFTTNGNRKSYWFGWQCSALSRHGMGINVNKKACSSFIKDFRRVATYVYNWKKRNR